MFADPPGGMSRSFSYHQPYRNPLCYFVAWLTGTLPAVGVSSAQSELDEDCGSKQAQAINLNYYSFVRVLEAMTEVSVHTDAQLELSQTITQTTLAP